MLTGLIAGSVGAIAPHLIRFAFPEPIANGGVPFVREYVIGLSALAILGVSSSALASLASFENIRPVMCPLRISSSIRLASELSLIHI